MVLTASLKALAIRSTPTNIRLREFENLTYSGRSFAVLLKLAIKVVFFAFASYPTLQKPDGLPIHKHHRSTFLIRDS